MKQTIKSPGLGILIALDTNEIYPSDPGQGTPVLIETTDGKYTATWDCGMDTGELDCGGYILNDRQKAWLATQETTVDEWRHANGV